MDNYDKIIEKIVAFKEANNDVSDSDISRILIEESVPLILIDDILEAIELRLSNNSDNGAVNPTRTQKNDNRIADRVKQCNSQQLELANMPGNMVKDCFISDLSKARIQTTYMPVTVLAFLRTANENGIADLDSIVDYFIKFYSRRKEEGLDVERSDSIFAKSTPTQKDVKTLILFNPLGRSCLIKYFVVDKDSGTISMLPNLWASLSISDAVKIRTITNSIIKEYYIGLKK